MTAIQDSNTATIKPTGDLTDQGAPDFQKELMSAVATNSGSVLVDLSRPAFISGRSLAAMLMARKSCDANGRTIWIKKGDQKEEFWALSGLGEIATQ